jgi:hypothetical protein
VMWVGVECEMRSCPDSGDEAGSGDSNESIVRAAPGVGVLQKIVEPRVHGGHSSSADV